MKIRNRQLLLLSFVSFALGSTLVVTSFSQSNPLLMKPFLMNSQLIGISSMHTEFAYVTDHAYFAQGSGEYIITGATVYIPYGSLPIPDSIAVCYNWVGATVGDLLFQIGIEQDVNGIKNLFWYVWDNSASPALRSAVTVADPDQSVGGRYFSMIYNGTGWGLYVDGSEEYFVQTPSMLEYVDIRSEHWQTGSVIDPNVYHFKDAQIDTVYGWVPFLGIPTASPDDKSSFTSWIEGDQANHYGIDLEYSASIFDVAAGYNMSSYRSPFQNVFYFLPIPSYPTPATLQPIFLPSKSISASADAGSNISPAGPVPVNLGQLQSFSISALPSHIVTHVWVDNVDQGPLSSYTFINVIANHTISVNSALLVGGGGGSGRPPAKVSLTGDTTSGASSVQMVAGLVLATVGAFGVYFSLKRH